MSRFTGAAQTGTGDAVVRPTVLVDIFGQRWTQSDAPVTWNGNTYLPDEAFSIDGVAEVSTTETRMLTIQILATDENLARASAAQSETWSEVKATLALLDHDGNVLSGISAPTYIGKVVAVDPSYSADSHVVQVTCQDIMSLMEQVGGLRFNSSDQKSRPGASTDTIFDTLPKLKGREIRWTQKLVNN